MVLMILERLYGYLKQNKVFGPVAILFGHLSVLILHNSTQVLMDKGELYSHGVITTFLAGAYIHSWSINNPHMAEPTRNLPVHELALSLAAGYYACNICTSKSPMEAIKNLLSIMAVSGILTDDKGGNLVVTYAFLYEVPTLFSRLTEYVDYSSKYPQCNMLFNLLHPVVLICCRAIGLWHLTFMIVANKSIPVILRAEIVLLTVCSFSTFKQTINMLMKSQSQTQVIPPSKERSRSKIRSRSRSISKLPNRGKPRARRC